ncbi:MAG: septal ring lytic transglycosylase RlpA family protein [Rubrobacteraceae bacterium]
MFTPGLRIVSTFLLVLGGLAVAYLVSQGVLGQEEPVEGAGRLVEAGKSGVAAPPEAPEVAKKEERADLKMTASYYGYSLAGLPTASGDTFDPEEHTAAHKSLPLGTELVVKRGGESVRVVVNDRGPYVAGRDLDLSVGAAREIGLVGPGEGRVDVVLV